MIRARIPTVVFLAMLLVPARAQQKPAEKPTDKPAPKWDVAADYGPTTKLAFDTT